MGWTFLQRRKGMTNREFFEEEFETVEILECVTRNFNEFYAACRNETGETFGLVCLIQWDNESLYNFGYKDMDETVGPGYHEAGRKVMEAITSPPTNEWAETWRKDCWEHIKFLESRPKVSKGDMVVFDSKLTFSNGQVEDHFFYEGGAKFRHTSRYGGRFHITSWRKRKYFVVPALTCKECGTKALLSGVELCPSCSADWVKSYAG